MGELEFNRMDELVDCFAKVDTRCGEEEYLVLVKHIEMCKMYTNAIDTSKIVNTLMLKYFREINIDPIYYSIVEHVSQRNFSFVVELSNMRDTYLSVVEGEPNDKDKHIAIACRFLEYMREGIELGYILYPA